MELRKSRRHRYFSINFTKGPCTKQASDLQFGSLLNMGSAYGSSDLATIAASNRAHGPLITISHWLIMGIDYGSLRSLNPYKVFDMKLFLVVPLGVLRVVLKRTEILLLGTVYCSPRIRLASWRSFGVMVTLLACIAHKFVSSNSPTKYASAAS